jgi:hypothetical protein
LPRLHSRSAPRSPTIETLTADTAMHMSRPRTGPRGEEAVPEGAERFPLPLFGGVIPVVRESPHPHRSILCDSAATAPVTTAWPSRTFPSILLGLPRVLPAPIYRLSGRS